MCREISVNIIKKNLLIKYSEELQKIKFFMNEKFKGSNPKFIKKKSNISNIYLKLFRIFFY